MNQNSLVNFLKFTKNHKFHLNNHYSNNKSKNNHNYWSQKKKMILLNKIQIRKNE